MSLIKKHVPIGVLNKFGTTFHCADRMSHHEAEFKQWLEEFGAVIHHDSGDVDEEAVVDMFYDYMANVDWRTNHAN